MTFMTISSRRSPFAMMRAVLLWTACCCVATAFSTNYPAKIALSERTNRGVELAMANDDKAEENPLGDMELTSSLARINQQWQIQQKKAGAQSRWTKLVLPKQQDTSESSTENVTEDPPITLQENPDEIVYLLEPSNSFTSVPSCLIVFVGGAGLGQFPQIAYSEFLKRLSDKLNAAVMVAPYTVGLDHFELAKTTGDRLRRAIIYCQDDPKRQYPATLPTFALSHSLGCKLQTIYVAATGQEYRGMGFIAYNNFGFAQTLQMARSFAEQLRGSYEFDKRAMDQSEDAFNMIFGMAENILGAVGLDFSPSSKDTERLIELKFSEDLQQKTRLFVMDDDDLDTSQQFTQCCSVSGPTVSGVPGTHLTPVYFKFGLDSFPEETRDMSREFLGGLESASLGDEGSLDDLVQEVSSWILGKPPSRPPHWQATQAKAPRLTGIDPNS